MAQGVPQSTSSNGDAGAGGKPLSGSAGMDAMHNPVMFRELANGHWRHNHLSLLCALKHVSTQSRRHSRPPPPPLCCGAHGLVTLSQHARRLRGCLGQRPRQHRPYGFHHASSLRGLLTSPLTSCFAAGPQSHHVSLSLVTVKERNPTTISVRSQHAQHVQHALSTLSASPVAPGA